MSDTPATENVPISAERFGASRGFIKLCVGWLILTGVAAAVIAPFAGAWALFAFISLIGILLFLAWVTVVPVAAIVVAGKNMIRRRYLLGVTWLGVLILGYLVAMLGADVGDALYFAWNKSIYDAVVSSAAAGRCSRDDIKVWGVKQLDAVDCGDPITIVFAWDGFLSNWKGVVYDAADEFAKRPPARAAAWKSRDIGELLSCSGASFSLGNHYYVSSGSYASGPEDCE